jgi:hypothetical protein
MRDGHDDDVLDLCRRLIAAPSENPPGAEGPVADIVERDLARPLGGQAAVPAEPCCGNRPSAPLANRRRALGPASSAVTFSAW